MLLLIPGLSQSVINLDIEVVFFKVDKGPLEDAAAHGGRDHRNLPVPVIEVPIAGLIVIVVLLLLEKQALMSPVFAEVGGRVLVWSRER